MRKRLGGALLWLALTLLALATALRWADIDGPWYVVGLQALRWVVGLWCVGALVVALAVRRRAASVVAALLVLVHLAVSVPAFRTGPTAPPGADDLVVMAANLELGRADAATVVDAVRGLDVDVLVLVELTPEAVGRLEAAGIGELLPEQVLEPATGPAGSGVLSRFPLQQQDVRPSRFAQPAVQVSTPGGPVLLRAAHPTPPVRFPARWHRELGELTGWAVGGREQDVPLVLAGDLNAGPDHPAFRRLTEVTTDAQAAVGRGWVPTWPQRGLVRPFVQLDHVLVRGLPVVDAGTVPVPRTDHVAVWARLGPAGG